MTEKNPFYGATFAERKANRIAAEEEVESAPAVKQIDEDSDRVEDKAMKPAESKRPVRKKS